MGLLGDAGSIILDLVKMKESYDSNKVWKQRRKEAFLRHIEKYIDEDGTLDVDNFMSRDSLMKLKFYSLWRILDLQFIILKILKILNMN